MDDEFSGFSPPGDKCGVALRNDGKVLNGNGLSGSEFAGGESWGAPGDTVGLGVNIVSGEVYFTKNGKYLGVPLKNIFTDIFDVRFVTAAMIFSIIIALMMSSRRIVPFIHQLRWVERGVYL